MINHNFGLWCQLNCKVSGCSWPFNELVNYFPKLYHKRQGDQKDAFGQQVISNDEVQGINHNSFPVLHVYIQNCPINSGIAYHAYLNPYIKTMHHAHEIFPVKFEGRFNDKVQLQFVID